MAKNELHPAGCMCPECGDQTRHVQTPPTEHPLIEAVKILRPEPGDIIAVKFRDRLPQSQYAHISRMMERVLPLHVQCILLEDGADIEMIRPVKSGNDGAPTWNG